MNDRSMDLAATITEHTAPFAVFWRDEHGGLVAIAARAWPDSAIVVRSGHERSVFTDDRGHVTAIAGRGWALVGSIGAPNTRMPGSVGFAGRVHRNEIHHVCAAIEHLSARRVHVAGAGAARFFSTVLGVERIERTSSPHGLARALVLARDGVGAAFDFVGPWNGWCRTAAVEHALANARRMGEWGVPPPSRTGSAMRAYANALVHERPWQPPAAGVAYGSRTRLLAAIDAATKTWSRSLVVDVNGTVWEKRRTPCDRLRRTLGITGIAFPTGLSAKDAEDAKPAYRIFVSPQRDIALFTSWDVHERDVEKAWIATNALPMLHGVLAEYLTSATGKPHDPDTVALAFGIATARVRLRGLTIGIEGLHVSLESPYCLQPLRT